ncbi:MAG TPA: gliding motility-associated C-terminal domain-containing protein [Flavobacteriales bacterium]|nr:gliding motility-associated C-terminal domain-containing protein [Flavobacteriales bacterium]HPH81817.1 gliding motility-associated C-terminal domain-containing protein [Flavobacteriales bacterium]
MNWTNYFRFLFLLLVFACTDNAHAQIQLAFQGGESGDNWTYTATAVSSVGTSEALLIPNIVSGSHSLVVGGVSGGGSCITSGSGNGLSIFHNFTFADIDISTSASVSRQLKFNYGNRMPACTGTGWDSGEDMVFTPIFDGIPQAAITIFTGATNATVDIHQTQYTFSIPACVGTFGFIVGVTTNRDDEFLFIDNVELTTPQFNGPIPSFSTIDGPIQACTGTSSIFSTDIYSGVNYHWFNNPSTSTFISPNDSTVADSITLDWGTTLPGTYTISVSPTDACGLLNGDTISITVELIDNPQPLTIIGPDTICQGEIATFSSNYLTGNVWSTLDTTQSIQVSQSGTYSVSAIGACGSMQSNVTLTVIPPSEATILINGSLALCPGQMVQLISSTDQNFSWSDQSLNDTLTVTEAGLYILTVSNACGTTADTVQVVAVSGNLQPEILSSGSVICSGSSLLLTSSENNGNSWSTGSLNDTILVTTPGTYILTVDNGCEIASDTLQVTSSTLSFTTEALPDSGNAPLDVNFLVNSPNVISSYSWDFAGLGSSSSATPNFIFNEAGLYSVIVEVTNDAGCSGLDTIEVLVLPELPSDLNVPNCFSPNGDSINDYFTVDATSIKTVDIQILNRWGIKMYQSSELTPGWDGKFNSENAPDGTYFYVLKAEGNDSKSYEFKGTLTLIR